VGLLPAAPPRPPRDDQGRQAVLGQDPSATGLSLISRDASA
jgi:hypothetical protein